MFGLPSLAQSLLKADLQVLALKSVGLAEDKPVSQSERIPVPCHPLPFQLPPLPPLRGNPMTCLTFDRAGLLADACGGRLRKDTKNGAQDLLVGVTRKTSSSYRPRRNRASAVPRLRHRSHLLPAPGNPRRRVGLDRSCAHSAREPLTALLASAVPLPPAGRSRLSLF